MSTIYDIAERVAVLFEPRLPGPVPCLKRMLPCGATFSQTDAEIKAPSREEEERIRGRLILTSVFPGGVTMRPLEEILKEVPLEGRSDTTIWRLVNEAGAKAYQILTQVDYADVSLPLMTRPSLMDALSCSSLNRSPWPFVASMCLPMATGRPTPGIPFC
jgi:hypothetical protein